jgi:hypothetical protein
MRQAQAERLLGLLKKSPTLKSRGFSLSCSPAGGIVIDRSGHVHGIWDFDGRCYTWLSPGSSEPIYRTGNPESAVLYTLVTLAGT